MKLLNLGCGNTRPDSPEWVNVDTLHSILLPGTPERAGLDALSNYVDADISKPLPFPDATFAGAILSHVIEHFDAQAGLRLLREVLRILMPGGTILASVPDASYFRMAYPEDRVENWPRLFDVTDPNNPGPTFLSRALWFEEHFAILTEDSLWCYLVQAGFDVGSIRRITATNWVARTAAENELGKLLNRQVFSVMMVAEK